jgi:hypothetical protein
LVIGYWLLVIRRGHELRRIDTNFSLGIFAPT